MRKLNQSVLSVTLALLAVVFSGTSALAAAETKLPPNFLIGDQDGINVDVDGTYMIDARKLQPGDVIKKTLTIQNLEQDDPTPEGSIPYTLTMRAEPLETKGPVNLLDQVQLTIEFDGNVLYQGRVRGDEGVNMIENALQLGVYATGDRKTMNITLRVDDDAIPQPEKSEADFAWHFYAFRALTRETPPDTGWLGDNAMYLLLFTGMLLACVLMFLKKKRREHPLLKTKEY
jgi:hypothetical protein